MRLCARITSPLSHPCPEGHVESHVTWEKRRREPGTPIPGGARGGQRGPQQGRIARDWMGSTNPHNLQGSFGEEILILEEIPTSFLQKQHITQKSVTAASACPQ